MIEIKNLSKVFQTSDGKVDALKNISLTIEDGDIYGIIGMSGAGKSTLVRCINMLERPTEGSVLIDKKNIGELSPKELRSIRREITMIFQGFNLLMQKTCLKNIMFPLKLAGVKTEEAKKKALELLEIVGLPDKANAYPAQLSGGQQQRIAIARAIVNEPKLLLLDEPLGALDLKLRQDMQYELIRLKNELSITFIYVTHHSRYHHPPDERSRGNLQQGSYSGQWRSSGGRRGFHCICPSEVRSCKTPGYAGQHKGFPSGAYRGSCPACGI